MLPNPTRRLFLGTAGLLGGLAAYGDDSKKEVPLAPPDKQPPDLDLPKPVKRKVGWAVVGLGKLALEEIMPAFAQCKYSQVTALVSGHPDKARQVASAYGVKKESVYNYDNYDKLSDNPDVEVIYVVLPNSMHAEFTIRGHKAGKHVLCEKPMAVSSKECEQMIAAAEKAKKKLMIAYRLRYEPFNQTVIEMCRKKEIGELRTFSASNCQVTQAPNIRLSRKLGGGPVGDVGIYCLNAARYVTGEEPVEVTAFAHQPKDVSRFREVPASVAFSLRFPSGVLAHCDCGFDAAESRRYRVMGTKDFIDLDPAFPYRGLRLRVQKGKSFEELRLREVNHFAAEMDHLSECVLEDKKPRTPGEEGLADLRAIEAIEEAAKSGKAVKVKS